MNIRAVYSMKASAEEIVLDLEAQLRDFETKVLILFSSSKYDQNKLAELVDRSFGDAVVFGCSTAGEIVSGKMLKESVVAMAFNSHVIEDVAVEVIQDVKENPSAKDVCRSFENYFGSSMADFDLERYVGIILIDGLCASEEKVMESIGDLTDVTFIGGSAGDDLKFACTHVYANGKAYSNGAVLALLKLKTPFSIIKTQSFCSLNTQLQVTKVNEDKREVVEFNHKPAALAYAEAVGVREDQAEECFMSNPVGLVVDRDNIFVRSPKQIEGRSMVFYCSIAEGLEVSLLKSTDIIEDTRKAIEAKGKELGGISGIINFNCILRTLELEQEGRTDQYGELFQDIPTIGFSTYGEEYIGHINQTATMLVFK